MKKSATEELEAIVRSVMLRDDAPPAARMAVLLAIGAVDVDAPRSRGVCPSHGLSAPAAKRLDKRIRAACVEAAADESLPEWARARARTRAKAR